MSENAVDGHLPSATVLADKPETTTLTGHMSLTSLLLTVLAFSAPIAVVAGYIPFTIMFGGEAATLVFVLATAFLLLFATGYVAMAKNLPKPGSFYAFVSEGLGKVTGLGSAFLAVVSYLLMLGGCFVFIGLTVTELLSSVGWQDSPWWLWGAIAWALVSVMCYFHIELSAKVLSVAMVLEVVVVMVFNVAVLVRGGGPEGYSPQELNPARLSDGDLGVALLFSIMVFLGFEATALFRDEVRDPDRTVPRATYGAVLFVGALYIVSCYLLSTAYGHDAVQVATTDPKSMFPDAIGHFAAPFLTQVTYILIVTSEVAAAISVHNVTARYLYNLGCDRALPSALAQVHRRHGSPTRAAVTVAIVVAVLLVLLGLANSSGEGLDSQLFGLGTVGVLVLMTLVSLAVIVWFARRGVPAGAGRFQCFVAPFIAICSLGTTVVLSVTHFDLVVGGAPGQNLGLLSVLAISLITGCAVAFYFRRRKPDLFAGLGRSDTGVQTVSAP